MYNDLPSELKKLVQDSSINLNDEEIGQLIETVCIHRNQFACQGDKLGKTDLITHKIDTGDARPFKHNPRRLNIDDQDWADEEVGRMLDQDLIEPSNSPWSSPIVVVKKKDGGKRLCIDFRKLNNLTLKDSYPLPKIDEALDVLSGATYFCSLDLASGYWQVPMDYASMDKTTFTCRKGLFRLKVMPFGLCNAPATFGRLMELFLAGLNWERCLIYIDDILIFGRDFLHCLENLSLVLKRLQHADLKIKPKKCDLFKKSVKYLGHIVSAEGVTPDPEKAKKVSTWPTPTTVKEVRQFVGLCSYYRKWIKDFASICTPLYRLTDKNAKFIWTPKEQEAFDIMKDKLTSAPVLAYPTREGKFILDTDASNDGIGAVLTQLQGKEERCLGYVSKILSKPCTKSILHHT